MMTRPSKRMQLLVATGFLYHCSNAEEGPALSMAMPSSSNAPAPAPAPAAAGGGVSTSNTSTPQSGGGEALPSPIVGALVPPIAPAAAAPDAMTPVGPVRSDLNFNLDWKYQQGNAAGAEAVGYSDAAWGYVDLPHSTKFVTPEDPNAYLGLSWYRKHFSVPAAYVGQKVIIEFGAAMQRADVWINGVHKVQHRGGYLPFSVDVTDDVQYGDADNVIAVQLDSNANQAWAPGVNGLGFQYHGGLYRDATLHVKNLLHVTDAVAAGQVAGGGVFVRYPSVSASAATVAVATHVLNERTADANTTLTTEVIDASGLVVGKATSTASIAPSSSVSIEQQIEIASPKLWHPDTPNLYRLRTTVEDDVGVVDQTATNIGIRHIEWSHDGGLSINGTRLKALGVNLHQEFYGLGNAAPDSVTYHELARIKEAGLNFIRGSHYPHAPAFYDAADALGILVLDAQTGWQVYFDTAEFNANTFQELREMIRRDRNHPSVVAWEANLNEAGFTDAWAQTADAIVHEEYPGDQAYSAAWRYPYADILMDATQHGIRDSVDTRPIIINEYGDWDYGQATSTSRQSREAGDNAMLIQAANVLDGTSKNFALSWFSVGGYWDYADYAGRETQPFIRCGLVDMYRLPKFAYYFMQSQRDPALRIEGLDSGPMVYIANHWTVTSPTTVRVYGNCDAVTLRLNGTLVATNPPNSGTNLPHPPFDFNLGRFTPGTLAAECLIAGAPVATFTRQTPGAAAGIALRPEATTLRADRSDARLVFIDILDANGTVVPTDASQVTLSITGPGSIVGPTTLTMKGGQLATWIRSGRTPGAITLTASAAGLPPASVELTSTEVVGLPPAPADRGE